jgi:hypothetical protein
MKRIASVIVAVAIAALAAPQPALVAASPASGIAAGAVKVTVNYKGKGVVDSSHQLWVWLFDTPNIGAGSMPIGQVTLDKNGAVAVFDGLSDGPVYVAVAFDEKGGMAGDGPPPSGTPIGVLAGKDFAPMAVVPGDKGVVTLVFDDSQRMP